MVAKLTVYTEIQTKPRPRAVSFGGHARVYTPKIALSYERFIATTYDQECGTFFKDRAIVVELTFHFKTPSGWPKWKQWQVDKYQCYCDKHKDIDNLAKSVLDALNNVAYFDDKQIIELHCTKLWTNDRERIDIVIYDTEKPTDTQIKEEFKQWKTTQKN